MPKSTCMLHARKRWKQMQFILDNFTEPVLESDGFGEIKFLKEGENAGYSPTGITLTILNTDYLRMGKEKGEVSLTQIENFMRKIQGYLPKRLRKSNKKYLDIWSRDIFSNASSLAPETERLVNELQSWYKRMKAALLNNVSFKYYIEGKPQLESILKRRFKDEYSEKIEQSVDAAVKSDNQINIVIEDA